MSYVKEVVVLRLNADTNEADFLKDAQPTFDLLQDYAGYIDRELSVSDDGTWVEIVRWQDLDTAMQAVEKIMESPIGQTFGQHIDPGSIQMYHVYIKLCTNRNCFQWENQEHASPTIIKQCNHDHHYSLSSISLWYFQTIIHEACHKTSDQ